MSSADNADWGRSVETVASNQWPSIQLVDDDMIDGRTVDAIETDGGHTVVEPETPIEVKACRIEVSGGRSGRWWLRKRNHETLVEDDGVYALGVYDERAETVRRLSLVGASTMDILVEGRWCDAGSRHETRQCAQLPWTEVYETLDHGEPIEIPKVISDD